MFTGCLFLVSKRDYLLGSKVYYISHLNRHGSINIEYTHFSVKYDIHYSMVCFDNNIPDYLVIHLSQF